MNAQEENAENMLKWTGERYLPFMGPEIIGAETHYEHLHRYAFASEFVSGKKVLDLASGEGYGSFMLSREAKIVVGIEIDPQAVVHAENKYIKKNIKFIRGSILNIPIEEEKAFDVIICFEAIEHIEDQDGLLSEVKRLLKDDGLFIVSTPNKLSYTDDANYHNPFHLKELYFKNFEQLLRNYFENICFFGQRVYTGSSIWALMDHATSCKEYNLGASNKGFYFKNLDERTPLYIVAIASNRLINIDLITSYLIDESNTAQDYRDKQISALTVRADTLEQWVIERDQRINELDDLLRSSNDKAKELELKVSERDQRINELDDLLRSSNDKTQELELKVNERDQRINELDDLLRSSNDKAKELELKVSERDQRINELDDLLRSSNDKTQELELKVSERDQRINELDDWLRSSNDKTQELELKVSERDQRINELDDWLRSSNDRAHELNCIIADMQRSVVWQLLMKYQFHFVERALPHDTKRREKYDLALKAGRILVNEGGSSFYKSFINFLSKQHHINTKPSEKKVFSPEERDEKPEEELLVHHQEVPLEMTLIEAQIELKKGNSRIRFHVPEGAERPCDIPDMKSGDCRCLSLAVKDISIWDGTTKLQMNWGSNWHGKEDSNGSTLRWLSNDATIMIDSNASCNAKLVLHTYSFYRPRTIKIYSKSVQTNYKFRNDARKKYLLLNSVERRADKNVVKKELEEILERLSRES